MITIIKIITITTTIIIIIIIITIIIIIIISIIIIIIKIIINKNDQKLSKLYVTINILNIKTKKDHIVNERTEINKTLEKLIQKHDFLKKIFKKII